jgi:Pentapeptide repeats (9 copies)
MSDTEQNPERSKGPFIADKYRVPLIVGIVLVGILLLAYLLQVFVERNSLPPDDASTPKEDYEIAKLAAEIRQIRSDTYGSLFWLKAVALFVTVGGAVGGYLIGQSRTTQTRLEHEEKIENRKNVDAQYQALVQELSDGDSAVLRAAAAVKLGHILKSFPSEWEVSPDRQEQLIELTKRVLAAALAIETDPKVQKTLTSALALHKPWKEPHPNQGYADLREIDLSLAKAHDAYWARVDFSYADFYRADLTEASLKSAILHGAQFRETNLNHAVLIEADCKEANFKLADLRGADLTNAMLHKTKFENVKVYDTKIPEATGPEAVDNLDAKVDISEKGDGSKMLSVGEWLSQPGPVSPARTS